MNAPDGLFHNQSDEENSDGVLEEFLHRLHQWFQASSIELKLFNL